MVLLFIESCNVVYNSVLSLLVRGLEISANSISEFDTEPCLVIAIVRPRKEARRWWEWRRRIRVRFILILPHFLRVRIPSYVFTCGREGGVKERSNLEDLGLDGNIILKCTFKKSVGRTWTGLIWPRVGMNGGCCQHGNETLRSKQCGEFRDQLRKCWILKSRFAVWSWLVSQLVR